MKPTFSQSLLFSNCQYIKRMTTASSWGKSLTFGIHICKAIWKSNQGMDSAEHYPGKKWLIAAEYEPFLRHDVAAGTLRDAESSPVVSGWDKSVWCQWQWSGALVDSSSGVRHWCRIRVPAPSTYHHMPAVVWGTAQQGDLLAYTSDSS